MSEQDILNQIEHARQAGKRIIATNGCFDVLHPGHIHLLKESKKLGDKLIVGLNTDNSIILNKKGYNRPINNEKFRKEMLESLPFVDEVVLFDDVIPLELIKQIKPDIITKGDDYTPINVIGNGLAKVVIIPRIGNHSTTKMVEQQMNKTNTIDSKRGYWTYGAKYSY